MLAFFLYAFVMSGWRIDILFIKHYEGYKILHGKSTKEDEKILQKIIAELRNMVFYLYGGPSCIYQSGGENTYAFVALTKQSGEEIEIEPGKSLLDFYNEHNIEVSYPKAPCLILRNIKSNNIEIFLIDRRFRMYKINDTS